MLVIDKPAGVAVHRGPKGGENLEDSFDALRFGLPRKPALAHRLDRDTAGCLILGRHHKALEKLGLLFKQGKIGKAYWAIVAGGPQADEGLIDKPLARRDASRGWWMKVDAGGLPSQTLWRTLGRGQWRLARTNAADRPHASIARPLRQRGLADPRRRGLRRAQRAAAAIAGATGRGSARPRPAVDRRRGACAAPHAGDVGGLRFCRRQPDCSRRRSDDCRLRIRGGPAPGCAPEPSTSGAKAGLDAVVNEEFHRPIRMLGKRRAGV